MKKLKGFFTPLLVILIAVITVCVCASGLSLASEVKKTHKVIKKDTLWEISEKYLGNPFLWPKLWQWNDFITNPHFIYPGSDITLYPPSVRVRHPEPVNEVVPEPLKVESLPEKPVEVEEPVVETVVEAPLTSEPRKYHFPEIKSSGLISDKEVKVIGYIIDAEDEKVMLSDGDIIYATLRRAAKIGDRYTIFKTGDRIKHPITNNKMGYRVITLGTFEIIGKTDSDSLAKAKIINTFDAISRGDLVKLQENIPEYISLKPLDAQLNGYIVAGKEKRATFGQGDIVYIDMGTKQGVEAGNTFVAFRKGEKAQNKNSGYKYRLPDITIGRLLVLHTKENSSVAIILDGVEEMKLGETIKTERTKD